MNIRKALQSGHVVRFHNHIGIDKQTTGLHSWGVALILQHIYPVCSKDAILHCLTHDAHEYFTGDIPAPVKWASPELNDALAKLEEAWEKEHGIYEFHEHLFEVDRKFIKLADMLEGLWFCILQVRIGNVNARRPFRKWRMAIDNHIQDMANDGHDVGIAYTYFAELTGEMEDLD